MLNQATNSFSKIHPHFAHIVSSYRRISCLHGLSKAYRRQGRFWRLMQSWQGFQAMNIGKIIRVQTFLPG